VASAYPAASFGSAYGAIAGRVTRGNTGLPIAGALVIAVRLSGTGAPQDSVASDYTTGQGRYTLRRLPAGSYAVRVAPLDGSVAGLVPGAIHERIAEIANTDFGPEWYGDDPESSSDDPDAYTSIAVAAGATVQGIDVLTNADATGPTITSVTPANNQSGIRTDSPLLVGFDEAVLATSLGTAFQLHVTGSSTRLGGRGQLLTPGLRFVFVPDEPLQYDTSYELEVRTSMATPSRRFSRASSRRSRGRRCGSTTCSRARRRSERSSPSPAPASIRPPASRTASTFRVAREPTTCSPPM
jgi:hypothetical protein